MHNPLNIYNRKVHRFDSNPDCGVDFVINNNACTIYGNNWCPYTQKAIKYL